MSDEAPLYRRLVEDLRALITQAEFPVGAKFLSERQVAERFATSRPTANKALAALVAEGLLEVRLGAGTFVAEPQLGYDIRALVSFTDKARALGLTPSTRILAFTACTAVSAPEPARRALGSARDLWFIERQRLVNDQAVIHERRYLVRDLVPGLCEAHLAGSLYSALADDLGLCIGGADQQIGAIALDAARAALLGAAVAQPALSIRGSGFLSDGRALWWEDTCYRADAYAFRCRLGNQDDGIPVAGHLA